VFQEPVLDKALTGRRNLELHARLWGIPTSKPASRADPLVGLIVVVSIPMVVDLPAPFGPSRPNTSPGTTWKSMPRRLRPRLDRSCATGGLPRLAWCRRRRRAIVRTWLELLQRRRLIPGD
jgi:hypothetical protein